jgi:hypothetical protein
MTSTGVYHDRSGATEHARPLQRIAMDGNSYAEDEFAEWYGRVYRDVWDSASPSGQDEQTAGAAEHNASAAQSTHAVEERREATDGELYTKCEFMNYYGNEAGLQLWSENEPTDQPRLQSTDGAEERRVGFDGALCTYSDFTSPSSFQVLQRRLAGAVDGLQFTRDQRQQAFQYYLRWFAENAARPGHVMQAIWEIGLPKILGRATEQPDVDPTHERLLEIKDDATKILQWLDDLANAIENYRETKEYCNQVAACVGARAAASSFQGKGRNERKEGIQASYTETMGGLVTR